MDDSNLVRKTVERTLGTIRALEIRVVRDAAEALDAYRQVRPDIVTLDITTPRTGGLTCLEELRRLDPHARVLAISALADRTTATDALRKGAAAYLCKPFTLEGLVEILTELRGDDGALHLD